MPAFQQSALFRAFVFRVFVIGFFNLKTEADAYG